MGLPNFNLLVLIINENVLIIFATFSAVCLKDYIKAGVLVCLFLLGNWIIAWSEANNKDHINISNDLESASFVKTTSSSRKIESHNNKSGETVTTMVTEEAKLFKRSPIIDFFAKYHTPAMILATALVPLVLDTSNKKQWLYSSLVVSPCALVISSTVTTTVAKARAAQLGLVIQGGAGCLTALARLKIQKEKLREVSNKKGEITVTCEDGDGSSEHARPSLEPDEVAMLTSAAWIGREYVAAVSSCNLFLLVTKMLVTGFVVAGYIPALGAVALIADLGACTAVALRGFVTLLLVEEKGASRRDLEERKQAFSAVCLKDYTKAGVLVSLFLLGNWIIAWFEAKKKDHINIFNDLESASFVKITSSSHTKIESHNNKSWETVTTMVTEEAKLLKRSPTIDFFAKYHTPAMILATALVPLGGAGYLTALARLKIQKEKLREVSSNKGEITVTCEDGDGSSDHGRPSLEPDEVALFLLVTKMLVTGFVVAGYIPALGAVALIADLGACTAVALRGFVTLFLVEEKGTSRRDLEKQEQGEWDLRTPLL
ncbi:hypothetical protein SELMODRAFT_417745 [Selaginella moellendorffii]|uniref:Uncharacterized protein n=1 Tax=Selaginella moellendorffii TaxID=88036 RepID=D8S3H2_SELML|nr:hypothetical protein SELMODRAFT_417745 [Selaginella moellendorffii]